MREYGRTLVCEAENLVAADRASKVIDSTRNFINFSICYCVRVGCLLLRILVSACMLDCLLVVAHFRRSDMFRCLQRATKFSNVNASLRPGLRGVASQKSPKCLPRTTAAVVSA